MSIFPEHPQMLAAEEFMVSVITLENAFLCPILVVGHLQSLIILLDSLSVCHCFRLIYYSLYLFQSIMANIIEEQDPNKKGTSAQMLWS